MRRLVIALCGLAAWIALCWWLLDEAVLRVICIAIGLAVGCLAFLHRPAPEPTVPELPPMSTTVVGQTLGTLKVEGTLGSGGMASVYRARTPEGSEVAVKVFEIGPAISAHQLRRFEREMLLARSLQHPAIVQVLDCGRKGDLLYLAMELMDGGRLRDHLVASGMPMADFVRLMEPVMEAVQYAHDRSIIHRDLKPENILLNRKGEVKVVDFGLARSHDFSTLTTRGSALGTPAYMCPEPLCEREITAASDQYSLGVVAFEMLTGVLPFPETHVSRLFEAHMSMPPPSLIELRPNLSDELETAVHRMLAKNPADRFSDIRSAWEALRAGALA
ncbi:MAG: serine/threonine-protein kinase [Candidatus Xenobia bacterium]